MNTPVFLSVIVPCRNEADYIDPFLVNTVSMERPPGGIEILIVDGMSDDGTREKITSFSKKHPEVIIIDNVKRITPAALNIGIERSRGKVILRLDVHTRYASDYLTECIKALEATGADNVGGPWVPEKNHTSLAKAIAMAFSSPFSVGGARSHDECFRGELDTVYLGCWPRTTFDKYGKFDEEFIRNQDDEHNLRIVRGGGRVWQEPSIKSYYTGRQSLYDLFRQYYQYGYWKVKIIRKHRIPASIRHIVPATFVISIGALTVGTAFWSPVLWVLLAELTLYFLCDMAASLSSSIKNRSWLPGVFLPIIFPMFHVGYGSGFIAGVFDFMILRRSPSTYVTALTRNSRRDDSGTKSS